MTSTKEVKTLENWFVGEAATADKFFPIMPVIRGAIDGVFIPFAPLLWFDYEKKILMTDKNIYKIGEPNKNWLVSFLAQGNSIEDLEINDEIH